MFEVNFVAIECRSAHLGNLVHVGIIVGGRSSLSSGGRSGAVGLAAAEVVLHLCIELLGCLGLGLAGATRLLLLLVAASLSSALGTVGSLRGLRGRSLLLLLSSVLGLAVQWVSMCPMNDLSRTTLDLRDTFAEALGSGGSRNARGADDDLDLCDVSRYSFVD